ncbi:uncharacterized protein [Rutidosis leptorrhynchoides]|uniref:uncharacterized protein n=1 Tax=Rutidosis leptorrhynchoides TaxID=125765 RepID=UPI003A9A2385
MNEIWQEEPEKIIGEVFHYCKCLFAESRVKRPRFNNPFLNSLSLDDANKLEIPFLDAIKIVVDRKARDRAVLTSISLKDFDSVNCENLLDVMRLMGFGGKWRKWIEACFKSASVSILVNGSPKPEFALERETLDKETHSPLSCS